MPLKPGTGFFLPFQKKKRLLKTIWQQAGQDKAVYGAITIS
jgi:hypothetical protein